MGSIIFILILLSSYFLYKGYLGYLTSCVRNHVYWILDNTSLHKTKLSDCVLKAQSDINIPQEYRLLKDEIPFVEKILSEYQNQLEQRLIRGNYERSYLYDSVNRNPKTLLWYSNLSDMEYFLVTLNAFLGEHECETSFDEYKLYTLKSRKDYGSWGGQIYDAMYTLTEYGVAYQKMVHICQKYCFQNKRINKGGDFSDHSTAALDSNEIMISRII